MSRDVQFSLSASSNIRTRRRLEILRTFVLTTLKIGREHPDDVSASFDCILVLLALAAELAQAAGISLGAYTKAVDLQWSSVRDHGGPLRAITGGRANGASGVG